MYCLWCHEQIVVETSWINIFTLEKKKSLCDSCKEQLIVLKGDRCKKCSRLSTHLICHDCKRWNENKTWSKVLTFNYSVYSYNKQIQLMLAKWKYRGDYVLGEAFKEQFVQSFIYKFSFLKEKAVLVPIPLSKERMNERAFNQAEMLASFLPMEMQCILSRKHSEKQSKKTRGERISAKNPFISLKKVNKPVIIVDDIYTTGTTLRHAAKVIKSSGSPKVYSYTLIRG